MQPLGMGYIIGHHFVRLRCPLAVALLKHTLLSWHQCFRSMGVGNGITTSSLLRRGCGCGKPDGGGPANAAHLATIVESADPRSRRRGRRPTPDAPRSRDRTDTGG